jgi:hypothetical protein
MASEIDPTVFPDNQLVDKADLREQFEIAKNEITALQSSTSTIRRMAVDDALWNSL